ncbi:MAG: glycosyltransferase family 39 protein, partial [bacterium]|nr:glycosyltransferase family 39 protein [bacterium]
MRPIYQLLIKKSLLVFLVFFVAFTYRLWGLKSTGALWDENAYFSSGFHYYYNLMHLQFDPDRDWGWIFEHPPMGKWIYGLGTFASYKFPDDPAFAPKLNFTFGRLESAVLGALTCVLIFLAGQEFFSTSVGLLSAAILAFLPIFAAYGRIIGLESPQAFFWTGAVYFFLRAVLRGENNRQYLMAGLWASLAFATKYNSGLLPLLFGLIFLAGKVLRVNDDSPKFIPRNFLLVPVMMAVFLYVTFPWLWRDPLNQFWKSFSFSKQHVGFADYTPLYYLKYFLATTPVVVIALALVPFINIVSFWRKREVFLRLALLLATLLPLSLSLFGFKGAGVRYVIFAFPSLALLAGLGGVNLLSGISKRMAFNLRQFRLAVFFLVILVSSYLVWQANLVHPYEVDYYSELVGGVKGALKAK